MDRHDLRAFESQRPSVSRRAAATAGDFPGMFAGSGPIAARRGDDLVRWSARRTLAFIVLSNGAFWATLGVGLWRAWPR